MNVRIRCGLAVAAGVLALSACGSTLGGEPPPRARKPRRPRAALTPSYAKLPGEHQERRGDQDRHRLELSA